MTSSDMTDWIAETSPWFKARMADAFQLLEALRQPGEEKGPS